MNNAFSILRFSNIYKQRQAANSTLRAVNERVLIMSEEPQVSAHNILPDM